MSPIPLTTWQTLIQQAIADRAYGRVASRHEGGLTSATKPQKFTCDDGGLYAVKFSENQHGDGRGIFTEQVVAIAGRLVGAPVPLVDIVEVGSHLTNALAANSSLGLDFVPQPGPHHGSRWVGVNISDRQGIQRVDENRSRFGALDVLYCWIPCTGDQQWIYNNDPPHEVYSVDHSTFFPGGFAWNPASLQAEAMNVARDPHFVGMPLQAADRADAVTRLSAITVEQIATVVARPPDEWGVDLAERAALASYLHERRAGVAAVCT